jgi:hypothetical protein
MKQAFFIIPFLFLLLGFNSQTISAQKTWEGYYIEFSQVDDFFQQDLFTMPQPSGRQRNWAELTPKARKVAKNHIKTFYGVTPSNGGYIAGALVTSTKTIGRVIVYVALTATAAVVVGYIINQPAESF